MQIEIDLTKIERGTHVGRVKVTRGGKTFYREQRVGRKEPEKVDDKPLFIIYEMGDGKVFKVNLPNVKKVSNESYNGIDFIVFKSPLKLNSGWTAVDRNSGRNFIYQDVLLKTKKQCIDMVHKNIDVIGVDKMRESLIKADKEKEKFNEISYNESKYDYMKGKKWEEDFL